MLAAAARLGVDAGHGENTGNERLDPLAPGFGIVEDRLGGRLQAAEHRQRSAGRAARGVDRHVDALAEPGDPLPRLPARGQTVGPLLRRFLGELVEREAVALRGIFLEPRPEVGWPQLREGEEDVGEIPLGVDDDRGDVVDRRLFDEADEQARLAAAGHADTDSVGRQPPGIEEERLAARLAGIGVDPLAEIKDAEPFDVSAEIAPVVAAALVGRTLLHTCSRGNGGSTRRSRSSISPGKPAPAQPRREPATKAAPIRRCPSGDGTGKPAARRGREPRSPRPERCRRSSDRSPERPSRRSD